jgi:uncharacterized protein YggU (UPF0235/DUF167 family)
MTAVSWLNGSLVLDLHVQPRASKDQIVGLHGDRTGFESLRRD